MNTTRVVMVPASPDLQGFCFFYDYYYVHCFLCEAFLFSYPPSFDSVESVYELSYLASPFPINLISLFSLVEETLYRQEGCLLLSLTDMCVCTADVWTCSDESSKLGKLTRGDDISIHLFLCFISPMVRTQVPENWYYPSFNFIFSWTKEDLWANINRQSRCMTKYLRLYDFNNMCLLGCFVVDEGSKTNFNIPVVRTAEDENGEHLRL